MSKFTTLSQSYFDAKAKEAVAKTPIRREFGLKDIEVINTQTLSLDGKHVPMSGEAFKGLCKIIGLPIGFDRTFSEAFGDKARQQLINKLKLASRAKGNTTVSLVLNPETKKIVGVQADPRDIISNQTFLSTSTQIIDKYGLEINDFSLGDDGTAVINASSPKNVWGLQGLKDEEFFGGVSFINSPNNGFQVSPYLQRLVCDNGMIGRSFEESMKLGQMDGKTMESFWNKLNSLADRGFRPESFEEKVRAAMNTRASLAEMESAAHDLRAYSDADTKELEAWIPIVSTKAKFHLAGIDTNTFSANQRKGAKTGTSVWDLVNGITHFATHNNGFKIEDSNRRKLQMEASRLLTKNHDMANYVRSPF